MREAWKRETYVRSQSFSSESAVKYLHVGQRKIQISPHLGEQDQTNVKWPTPDPTKTINSPPHALPPPPPPQADPLALAFVLPWMANSAGWELSRCQSPGVRTKKRANAPSSVNTATIH